MIIIACFLQTIMSLEYNTDRTCLPLHHPDANVWQSIFASGLSNPDHIRHQAQELDFSTSICLASINVSLYDIWGLYRDTDCYNTLSLIFPNFNPPYSWNLDMVGIL